MGIMNRRLMAATAVVGACLVAPAGAAAQVPPVPDITDAAFLAAAAQSNRFEIVSGRLAARRGRSSDVRRLGRQFVRHHRTQLQLGAAVAAGLGIAVPPGSTPSSGSTSSACAPAAAAASTVCG